MCVHSMYVVPFSPLCSCIHRFVHMFCAYLYIYIVILQVKIQWSRLQHVTFFSPPFTSSQMVCSNSICRVFFARGNQPRPKMVTNSFGEGIFFHFFSWFLICSFTFPMGSLQVVNMFLMFPMCSPTCSPQHLNFYPICFGKRCPPFSSVIRSQEYLSQSLVCTLNCHLEALQPTAFTMSTIVTHINI